jgi:protein gp37
MRKTLIDWCDSTINPVVGCPRGCEYCYARKLNTRFKWIPDFSKPKFFPERLKEFESKKPKSIFMNSMSDVALWSKEQKLETLKAMADNTQHTYIVLSKNMSAFELSLKLLLIEIPLLKYLLEILKPRFYIGYTGTDIASMAYCRGYSSFTGEYNYFLNIEPIHGSMSLCMGETLFKNGNLPKAVIIGAETGNRKGKVIPQKQWIDDIVRQADERKVKVFMKESLRQLMGKDFRQDKLIWEVSC